MMDLGRQIDALACYSHALRDLQMQLDGLGYLDMMDDDEIRINVEDAERSVSDAIYSLGMASGRATRLALDQIPAPSKDK